MKIKVILWGDPLAKQTLEFWKTLSMDIENIEISEDVQAEPWLIYKKKLDFDIAFLSETVGESLVQHSSRLISIVKDLGWADVLLREDGHLWPRLFQREALRVSIVRAAPNLDSHSVGYMTGKGPEARMVAAVLIQLGFEKLAVVSDNPGQVEAEMQFLLKKFFDIQIRFLSEPEMTLQPNNGSIIVNTIPHEEKSEILDDLPYLNYIKKEGLVVDLPFDKGPNQLIDEAAHVEMRVLNGVTVRGQRDYLLLSQIAKQHGETLALSESEYLSQWDAFELKS